MFFPLGIMLCMYDQKTAKLSQPSAHLVIISFDEQHLAETCPPKSYGSSEGVLGFAHITFLSFFFKYFCLPVEIKKAGANFLHMHLAANQPSL